MKNEKELLELAKDVLEMNKSLKPMLTGSLMLYVRGIDKRREAHDIDILVNTFDWDDLNIPDGFEQSSPQYEDAIQFSKDGIKIDFLFSNEKVEDINGVNCGSVKLMLDMKYKFSKQERNPDVANKHLLDLEYLHYDFPIKVDYDELPW